MPRRDAAWTARAMMVLLIARVIAAPIALNPSALTDPHRPGLIMRVCSWPVQEGRPVANKLTTGEWTPSPAVQPCQKVVPSRCAGSAARGEQADRLARHVRRALDRLQC